MTGQIRSAEFLVTKALANPDTLNALKSNPEETLKSLSKEVVDQLPRALTVPDTATNNAIWLIVVVAFSLVMVGSAYVLGTGVTTELDSNMNYATKGDTVLTVFTTVVAFLAGLISPSPVKK